MPKQSGNVAIGALTAAAIGQNAGSAEARRVLHRSGISMLATVPLFARLSRRHLARIANVAEQVQYGSGRVVVRAGTPGRSFFILVSGRATLSC